MYLPKWEEIWYTICPAMLTAVIGLQWGDEGKGKIVDLLSKGADFVVRFHGGNNAGHTIVTGGKTYPLHLVPSGILHRHTTAVIANGTILDLEVLKSEVVMLEKEGVNVKGRLFISPRCHLIMPYHKLLDEAFERGRGEKKLGTTKRGIGPCLADKVSYQGIRVEDLMSGAFKEKFTYQAKLKNKVLQSLGVKPLDIKKAQDTVLSLASFLKPFVKDTYSVLRTAHTRRKNIFLEGAQGVMLDVDFGIYPYVTGSNILPGAINTGAGLPPGAVKKIYGVVKAYTSNVSRGPFPTEIAGKKGEQLREAGAEYGTTTGRPRRVGWLDLEAVRFATEVSGTTDIIVTKLDVLSGMSEIKVSTGYTLHGKKIRYSAIGYKELTQVTPSYKILSGWKDDISGIRSFNKLPQEAKTFIRFIGSEIGVPIRFISVGAERSATITV